MCPSCCHYPLVSRISPEGFYTCDWLQIPLWTHWDSHESPHGCREGGGQSILICSEQSSQTGSNLRQSLRRGEIVGARDFGKSRSFNWVLSIS